MKTWILLPLAGLILLWGNPAFSQPIIHVWGTADSLTLKDQVALYLDYLDVEEKVFVSVGFTADMPEALEGITFCMAPSAINPYLIIKVRIDTHLNKTRQKFVLAHEMIHVKQYAKGEISVLNNQQVVWKGRKYDYQGADGKRVPWEMEAYKTDNLLAKRCKLSVEAPLVAVVKKQ